MTPEARLAEWIANRIKYLERRQNLAFSSLGSIGADGFEDFLNPLRALEAVLAIHEPWEESGLCSECSQERGINFPCPTVRKITEALGMTP